MKFDITQLLLFLIYIVPVIVVYVLKVKPVAVNSQWTLILKWIIDGVKAAETSPEFVEMTKAGKQKFEYVLLSVKDACEKHKITYDETLIKNAIQAAWNDLYNNNKE